MTPAKLLLLLLAAMPCLASFSAPGTQHCYGSVTTGTSVSCALPANPATGSVVLAGVHFWNGGAINVSSVADSAASPNSYTFACSTTNVTSAGGTCSAYLIAPGTANKTVTANFTATCGACSIALMEFPVSGGTAAIDGSIQAGSGTGNAVNAPTLTPTGTDLLFGTCANNDTCAGVTGTWTLGPNGVEGFSEAQEYILNTGSSTAVGFTGSSAADPWDSTGVAFKFTASGVSPPKRLTILGVGF